MGDPFPLDKTYSGVKEDRSVCCAWECGLLIRKDSLVKGTGSFFFKGRQLLRSYLLAAAALAAGWRARLSAPFFVTGPHLCSSLVYSGMEVEGGLQGLC